MFGEKKSNSLLRILVQTLESAKAPSNTYPFQRIELPPRANLQRSEHLALASITHKILAEADAFSERTGLKSVFVTSDNSVAVCITEPAAPSTAKTLEGERPAQLMVWFFFTNGEILNIEILSTLSRESPELADEIYGLISTAHNVATSYIAERLNLPVNYSDVEIDFWMSMGHASVEDRKAGKIPAQSVQSNPHGHGYVSAHEAELDKELALNINEPDPFELLKLIDPLGKIVFERFSPLLDELVATFKKEHPAFAQLVFAREKEGYQIEAASGLKLSEYFKLVAAFYSFFNSFLQELMKYKIAITVQGSAADRTSVKNDFAENLLAFGLKNTEIADFLDELSVWELSTGQLLFLKKSLTEKGGKEKEIAKIDSLLSRREKRKSKFGKLMGRIFQQHEIEDEMTQAMAALLVLQPMIDPTKNAEEALPEMAARTFLAQLQDKTLFERLDWRNIRFHIQPVLNLISVVRLFDRMDDNQEILVREAHLSFSASARGPAEIKKGIALKRNRPV